MALIEVLEFDAAEQVMGEGPPVYDMLVFSEQGPPGPPGPQGVPGPVGTIDNAGVLTKPMKLSEFDTPTLKAEARANLELEYIDCGTFN